MSIFVFKERSVPAWEHKSNENAGRWIIVLNDNHNLHNAWNNMVCIFKTLKFLRNIFYNINNFMRVQCAFS